MFSRFQILVYYYFLRITGKVVGWFAHLPLPPLLNKFVVQIYAYFIDARLYEINQPLEKLRSISEFFTREIHPRAIGLTALVSPVDGIILDLGQVQGEDGYKVHQIKGISYTLNDVLGLSSDEFTALKRVSSQLYYVSIQLPLSECHRFHSPVDWHIRSRTHIPGTMFALGVKRLFKSPFVFYNERVVIEGEWKFGQFYFVAFGSNEVGSIVLNFDPHLHTNVLAEEVRQEEPDESFKPLQFNGLEVNSRVKKLDVHMNKGDEMGRFEGGSAFLLVFQLDKSKIHENRSNHEDGRQSNGSEEAKEHSAVAENVHQPKDDQNEAAEIGSSDMVWSVSPPQFVTYGSPLSHLC